MKKNLCALLLAFVISVPLSSPWAQQKAPPPPGVIAYTVTTEEWIDKKEALGTLRANESIVITPNVSETVAQILFESGDIVEKDQTILLFDQAEEQAALKAAKARFNERELAYKRAQDLMKKEFTSKSVLDERKSNLEETRAEIALIEARIKDRTITAPFKGVLGLRNISLGAFVQANDVITTLDDISVVKMDFSLPETYLPFMKTGMAVSATTGSFKQEFHGQIQSIDSRVDPVTRSVTVRALLDNPDYILRPGMLMTVQILKDGREVTAVPEETIIMKGAKSFVYTLTPESNDLYVVSEVEIKTGARNNGIVEVVEGLQSGTQIVSHGLQLVKDKAKVKITAIQTKDTPISEIISKDKPSQDKALQETEGK